jgi:hypothetical protein
MPGMRMAYAWLECAFLDGLAVQQFPFLQCTILVVGSL